MPRLSSSPTGRALLLLTSVLALPAHAAPAPPAALPRTISVDELHPGMTGYGLTVFEGTRPDRFPVRVVGVLHNFLPRQDIILIRSDDPRLVHAGIVAGMSGSPIYIDGRLAGALSYGWHFAKDPIAGVTPIANMLSELKRPLRGRDHTPVAEAMNDPFLTRGARGDAAGSGDPFPARAGDATAGGDPLFRPHPSVDDVLASAAEHSRRPMFLDRTPLPPLPAEGSAGGLVRAAVPLSLAGFGAASFDQLGKLLEPYHVTPLAAGGTGRPGARGPTAFEQGGAIAVDLIRGDMAAEGTGTVTWVDGKDVLGFGHPMFNIGELYLPVSTAEIHGFMTSLSSSFKFSTPLVEIGSLVQDRQSCIAADTTLRSDMIPVHVRVGGPGRPERVFDAQVVRHRFLTPMLAATVVANAGQEAISDVADATITLRTALDVRGFDKLELVDHAFSPEGVSQRVFASSSGIKAIGDILFNQFAPANLDRIDVQVEVDFRPDVAEITGVSLRSDEIEPGSRPSLVVTLRPYNGPEYSESIPIEIPASLAGQSLKIEAAAGNLVKPDLAPPENLRGMLENLTKTYPARSIVVTVQKPDEGLTLRGSVVPDLPSSVMDTLKPGASTRRGESYKLTSRQVVTTRGVVLGKRELAVKVKDVVVH